MEEEKEQVSFEGNYMENDLTEKKHKDFFPSVIRVFTQHDNNLVFKTDNDVLLEVSVITDKVIRFRFSTDGYFQDDFSYALKDGIEKEIHFFEFKEKDDHFRITTDRLIVTIAKENMQCRVLDRSGNVLLEDENGFHWQYNQEAGGDIVKMSKKLLGGEHFYGLGDKSFNMDMRGKRVQMWGSDTYGYVKESDPLYKNIPFYYAIRHKIGYGIFFDNTFRSFFDFGSERHNVTSFWAQGGEMNYYFIYGPELMEVAQDYTKLTGTPELPPMWALGYHQCKWSYYPESKFRIIASEFRKRKIPCDALYLDIDYMDGFRCFTWNKEYFPDPKKMIGDLEKEGFKTVVIIDPGIKIDKTYWVYQEGFKNDYFCKRADGPLMKGSVWPGLCNFPDFTNPKVREWWEGLFKGLIEEDGVKGVWNDMNEPAVFEEGTFPMDVRHNYDGHPCSHRKAHNIYGMQMARATYNGVKKFMNGKRPFTITRSGYSGSQRFSSAWTGDNIASWDHLWLANIQCQRLSISGWSFVGSDIGGFIEQPTGELYVRWIQLAVFHPFFRTHSSGDHGDQEPWSLGEEVEQYAKQFIELRYQLLPYIYSTFWQYVTTGKPMLRPLVFLSQKDLDTYWRMAEFGFGDNLLVAPITESEVDGRWMYLPDGYWYYYWDDTLEDGDQEVWAEAGMDRIPIFVKAGAVLPINPVMQYVGEKKVEELTLHAYYKDGQEKTEFYEDEGEGYGYREGKYLLRSFITEGKKGAFTIHAENVGEFVPEYGKVKIVLHGLPFVPSKFTVDGKEISLEKEQKGERVIYSVVTDPLFKDLSVEGK